MTALAGVIVMAVNCDEGTVTVALPQVEPAQALTVTLPAASAYTEPELVESLVTVAIVESEELQDTDARVWLLPLLNVPVATSCCPVPIERVGLFGLIEIDTSAGGALVAGM